MTISWKSRAYSTYYAPHFHPDHFQSRSSFMEKLRPDIRYIFSKDILKHPAPQRKMPPIKGRHLHETNISVSRPSVSTDVGISFLIDPGQTAVPHAGDLNNWPERGTTCRKYARPKVTFWPGESCSKLHPVDGHVSGG